MPFAKTLPVSFRQLPSALLSYGVVVSGAGRWARQLWDWRLAGQGAGHSGSCTLWTQGHRETGGGASPDDEFTRGKATKPTPYHRPVLPEEVTQFLEPSPGKVFLDATLGGGGHSELLLEAGAEVIAIDQDSEALKHARQRLRGHGDRFRAFHANFRNFAAVLEQAATGPLDGILADLGVSSRQLDSAARGFSFSQDGPLDMRMNQQAGRSAADLVNESDVTELARILFEYGEERQARRISRAIVERRAVRPFATTGDLAAVIASASPRHGKMHPATQSFQALRIAVNEELAALAEFLAQIPLWLKPGGRVVLISFHSMEDRMVKQAFAKYSTEWLDRPEWPEPRRNPDHTLRLLMRKPVEASAAEVKSNPRARSAKLRAAERISA